MFGLQGVRARHRSSDMDETERRFERLFEVYEPQIRAYCARRLEHGSVDDAVAETFSVAWAKIASIPDDAELPWLYGVAHRVVQHVWRSDGRRVRLGARTRSIFERPRDVVVDEVEAGDDRRRVLVAASRLDDADQEILRLTLWEEISPTEAAVALGITPDAAKQRAARARRRLAVAFHRLAAPPATTAITTTSSRRTAP